MTLPLKGKGSYFLRLKLSISMDLKSRMRNILWLQNKKNLAGRNTLMFLVVVNLALYLLETIVIKSKANQKVSMEFYEYIKLFFPHFKHKKNPLVEYFLFKSFLVC